MAENPEFLKALHTMMKALPLIKKDESAFKYKYATLESIIEQWEPVFEEHGFMLRQFTESGRNGEWDVVITKLTHLETGESEEYSLTLPVGTDWQHTGSGCTYFKRYTLTNLRHPVGEDFDGLKTDAELKGKRDKPSPKPAEPKPNGSTTITPAQRKRLFAKAAAASGRIGVPAKDIEAHVKWRLGEMGVKDCSTSNLTAEPYKVLCEAIDELTLAEMEGSI